MDEDWLKVQGRSMRPFLKQGDWIAIHWFRKARMPKLKVGDIVLLRDSQKEWVVHRVVDTHSTIFSLYSPSYSPSYKIKGDRSLDYEVPINLQIWGKMIGIKRQHRKPCRFSANRIDRFIALLSKRARPQAQALDAKLSRGLILVLGSIRRIFL